MERQDGRRHPRSVRRAALTSAMIAGAVYSQFVASTNAQSMGAKEPNAPASRADAIEASLRNDAALADLFFANRTLGWAVGDRGVLWHTSDGGASWQQQASGVSCRLNSVFFIDALRGWAAGGLYHPRTRSSQGVVLQTVDGGATWNALPNLNLPLLTRIKFFNPNVGVAAGAGSAAHPSGLFVTRDAGRTWQPLPADKTGNWTAADFLDAETGALAASAGEFATIAQNRIRLSPLSMPSARAVHVMQLVAPSGGWLVGDGGLVRTTADLGHSWQSSPGDLPPSAAADFDFHALAVYGDHVWIAGSPGTRVFHSPDAGRTWHSFATGQFTPIRTLTFFDAAHGWAAGDLGRILATSDGGRTWRPQRAGGTRAALVAVFATATDVPLEVLAEQGAAEGYITAVDLLHAEHIGNRTDNFEDKGRAREAMILAGAAAAETAWRFPLPQGDAALTPADLLATLNRENDGRAVEQLERHLVRNLRMWRPDVVVTPSAMQDESESMATVVEHLVLRAIDAAADPTQFIELTNNVGLEPWQVKTAYGVLTPGARGLESLVTNNFLPLLGTSPADWVAPARRLLITNHFSPPDTYSINQLFGEVAAASGHSGMFRGIALARGSDARRAAPEMPPSDSETLRRMAMRRKHLQELLERSEGNVAWAGQVSTLIEDLDARGGGELLFQLASGYRAAGRLDLAADSYYLLARRYPQHPLADEGLLWLIQFYASSEAAHRAAPPAARWTLAQDEMEAEGAEINGAAPGDIGRTEVRPTAFAAPATGLSRDERLRRATQLADYLKSARPMLYAEPAVRFAEVAAQRQLGYSNPARRYFLSLGERPASDPWRQCAETEQWLAQPGDQPPLKTIAGCRRTYEPPHLDGRLDEPFWDAADRLRLRGESGQARNIKSADNNDSTLQIVPAAEVRLAYDDAFLYIAVQCPKAIAIDYPEDNSPRPRDADLSQHDRVTLQLDLDRDFTTAFHLSVDHRGWTHDACWSDATWNPNWYVAAASDEATWFVEAAMPLAELTAIAPTPKQVWAVAVRRTIPRIGHESWSGAIEPSPDQFGILLFQ